MREYGPAVQAIPGSIAKAIALVQAGVKSVQHDGRNDYDRYDYSSTDAIYAGVSRLMSEHGLVVLCLESEPADIKRVEVWNDKAKQLVPKQWGKFNFQFVLAVADDTWTDARCSRSLFIEISRPTAFMAAQSYAEKSFLRSLFKIPTGDKDLEELDADPPKKRSKASLKAEGAEWDQFNGAVDEAGDYGSLAEVEMKWRGKFPVSWDDAVADVIAARRNELDRQFGEAA
ncbi:MAG: ERF family protein [Pseudomonadota bacterium]